MRGHGLPYGDSVVEVPDTVVAPAPAPAHGGRLALAAALVTVTLWASAFVGIRSAGRDLSPGALSLGRNAVAVVALAALVALRPSGRPARADLPALALCGLLWFGLYNVVLNEAERRVDAGTAAMLVNVGPILIAVLAGLLLHEGFPRGLVAGCSIAFAGVVVIGVATSGDGARAGWGAALCLVAALAYACAVILQKPVLDRASALWVVWIACLVGTIACLPFAPTLVDELAEARPGAIVWVVYLGVFPTAVAFTTWAYALARTTAGRMGSTTYLAPPLAIAMAWALLGETPPLAAIPGGALCVLGVIVARRSR